MTRALRRSLPALAAAALVTVAPLVLAGPAAAEEHLGGDDSVTRYDLAITLDGDGVAHVVLDLELDFGSEPNHGPYLTYVVKERYDDTQDRVYRFTGVHAESLTDAPADVEVEEDADRLVIRIGDEDRGDLTGPHAYRVTYDVEGWVDAAEVFGNESDELYLDVVSEWQLPLRDVSVRVEGPAAVTETLCFVDDDDPCTAAAQDDGVATFAQDELGEGEAFTVVAAFPAGTFGGVEPIVQERWSFTRAFALTPLTGGLAVLLTAGGVGAVLASIRRGRSGGRQGGTLTPAQVPVPVRLTPPEGFRPGQLGTLLDGRADAHDVTATLVDLAVRGYLLIEARQDDGGDPDWVLVRVEGPDPASLAPYEQLLLQSVFDGRDQVALSALRTTFASAMADVQTALHEEVVTRGWFRANPASVRNRWLVVSVLVTLVGLAVTVALAIFTSSALVGVPIVVVGVLIGALSGSAPARTPQGTAVLDEVRGFRDHLATSRADQLQTREDEDMFSRYLPYAIAFGLTERYARGFAELAAGGGRLPQPSWYVGPVYGAYWATGSSFTADLTRFTDTAGTAISAPAPGTAGSSGTSGGFAGGGVGGGGGGSW